MYTRGDQDVFVPPPRVLLADDHPMITTALKALLEPTFSVAEVVEDGIALLEAAEKKRHDVIIADISMPRLDGLEATRELKRRDAKVPVLILSRHAEADWVRRAFAAGASGYLTKKAALREVETALGEILRGGTYVSPLVAQGLLPAPRATTAGPIRVVVVDDHDPTRVGIVALSESVGDIEVVGEAADGRQAMARVESERPDVVLMDLQMPEMDGLKATREVLARYPATRILITTASDVNEQVLAAIRAGAIGYQYKGDADYPDAIRRAHRGENVFPAEVRAQFEAAELAKAEGRTLTRREIEIAGMVAEGLKNQEVAQRLDVSLATVRSHMRNIFDKLELSNRVELALYAIRSGWAQLG